MICTRTNKRSMSSGSSKRPPTVLSVVWFACVLTTSTTTTSAFLIQRQQQSQSALPRLSLTLDTQQPSATRFLETAAATSATATSTRTSTNRSRSRLFISTTDTTEVSNSNNGPYQEDKDDINSDSNMPPLGNDGVYHIENKEQHAAFLKANPETIIVLKCYAPWCRACKGLEPKFLQVVNDPKYKPFPLVFADLSVQHNKAFVQSLGVLALPTVQFYVGGVLADTFPCGPSKVPILKRKLAALINEHIDSKTMDLKESSRGGRLSSATQAVEAVGTEAANSTTIGTALGSSTTATSGSFSSDTSGVDGSSTAGTGTAGDAPSKAKPTEEQRQALRQIPYLSSLTDSEFEEVLLKVRKLTFEPFAPIMIEGNKGRTFYVIEEGEVEICQRTGGEDPMAAMGSYLGTVINRLGVGEHFGERALVTGEPRAASIRASDEGVTAWAFDRDDFPPTSLLSGQITDATTTDFMDFVNDKYGVTLPGLYMSDFFLLETSMASQSRGSPNSPRPIRGVDTDEDVEVDGDLAGALPESDGLTSADDVNTQDAPKLSMEGGAIFSLLTRMQMIRHVSRCLEYIQTSRASWGDANSRKRRNMLVSRLPVYQQAEFTDTFNLIDVSGDGKIETLELRRVMDSIGEQRSDEELKEMIQCGDSPTEIDLEDFMGIMAESEFYYLFRDTFAALDKNNSGFVKAGELNNVLCGVRGLVNNEAKCDIVDVEDLDMLIDYEQFSRMLLGTALK